MTVRRSDFRADRRLAARRGPRRWLRGLGLALGLLAAVQCSDQSTAAPRLTIAKRATLALTPSFATLPAGAPAIDLSKIRGVLQDAAGNSVISEALFQDGTATLVFTVQFSGASGTFTIDLTAYDTQGQVAFHGVGTVTVKPGTNPPVAPPPLQYAGPDAGVTQIQVVPNPVVLAAGATAGLAVTGTNAAGQPVNAAIRASWVSRAPAVAAVDPASGLVTAGALEGTTYIVATSVSGAVDSAQVLVHAPIATFTVTPNPAQVARGESLQLTPVMQDAAGHPITGRPVLWTIDDQTKATISATGLLSGKALGATTVSALAAGKSVIVPVTVVSPVDHIEATPNPLTLAALGAQQTLAVTVVPHGTADVSHIPVTVTVADPSVVAIDANDVVTALKNGSTTIILKADVATLAVPVTVKQVATTVAINPKGFSASARGVKQQFSATILDSRGQPVVGATPAWATSNPAVVTVDANGLASSVDDGSAQVTVSVGGISDAAAVTVKRVPVRVSINVPSNTLLLGTTMNATAAVLDANGYPMTAAVNWASSDTGVFTVDATGLLTAVYFGSASLQASAGDLSTGINITVTYNYAYGQRGLLPNHAAAPKGTAPSGTVPR